MATISQIKNVAGKTQIMLLLSGIIIMMLIGCGTGETKNEQATAISALDGVWETVPYGDGGFERMIITGNQWIYASAYPSQDDIIISKGTLTLDGKTITLTVTENYNRDIQKLEPCENITETLSLSDDGKSITTPDGAVFTKKAHGELDGVWETAFEGGCEGSNENENKGGSFERMTISGNQWIYVNLRRPQNDTLGMHKGTLKLKGKEITFTTIECYNLDSRKWESCENTTETLTLSDDGKSIPTNLDDVAFRKKQ